MTRSNSGAPDKSASSRETLQEIYRRLEEEEAAGHDGSEVSPV